MDSLKKKILTWSLY